MRKNYHERFHEILDAAEQLFIQKGYENATINDILDKVKIGKGTFYYYFCSKEEVMVAVVDRMVQSLVSAAKAIAGDATLNAPEKMKRIILSLNISESPGGAMIEELHQPSNAKMHQNSIVATVKAVAPVLASVIEQGIQEGHYSTPYPQETIEILLAANQFIFDAGIFPWEPEELKTRAVAFVHVMELALGAQEGSFRFILDVLAASGEKRHFHE